MGLDPGGAAIHRCWKGIPFELTVSQGSQNIRLNDATKLNDPHNHSIGRQYTCSIAYLCSFRCSLVSLLY